MSWITGNKRNIGAKSNLGFPMKLAIFLKFRSVVLSTCSPMGTFDQCKLSRIQNVYCEERFWLLQPSLPLRLPIVTFLNLCECLTKLQGLFRSSHLLILYFPIPHNALCLPPKFCINCCCGMLLGICRPPKSIS